MQVPAVHGGCSGLWTVEGLQRRGRGREGFGFLRIAWIGQPVIHRVRHTVFVNVGLANAFRTQCTMVKTVHTGLYVPFSAERSIAAHFSRKFAIDAFL